MAATARRPPAAESPLLAARRGDARARCSRPLGRPPRSRRLDTQPSLDAAACASCTERGASLAPCSSARSHARGRDGSTAARRRVAAARRLSRRRSRALLAPAQSAAAFATARHSAAARRGGLRLVRRTRRVSCAVLLCAVTRPWPQRLDGRPPSSRCCSPLVAATLAHAARARSVGRRVRDGSTLGRRSLWRPAPPALNAARLLRRDPLRSHTPWPRRLDGRPPSSRCCSPLVAAALARAARARSVGRRIRDGPTLGRRSMRRPSPALNAARFLRRAPLRGHTPVAATTRRPPAVELLLLAARRGDARARSSRPLGRPPHSRRLDTRPPLDAAAFASYADRSASLAPCFSARSHARGRNGSTAARRRVAAARRSPRRRSRAPLAPAQSAAAFATARHSAAARRGGRHHLHRTRRVSCAVLLARAHARGREGSTAARRRVAAARRSSRRPRARCSRPLGRPPRSRRLDTRPPLDAAACAPCAERGAYFAPCFSARSHVVAATDLRPPAVESLLLAARRGDARARCSRPLGRPPHSRRLDTRPPLDVAAFASYADRGASLAPCFSAQVARPWPQRLDGRPPPGRRCSPLVAATLARAARARSVGRRIRDGPTLGRRSMRRPSPPALNAARFLPGRSARRRLALASGSRADRAAPRATRGARSTLRATLRTQHFARFAPHTHTRPHRTVRSTPTRNTLRAVRLARRPYRNIARRLLVTRAHASHEPSDAPRRSGSPTRRRLALVPARASTAPRSAQHATVAALARLPHTHAHTALANTRLRHAHLRAPHHTAPRTQQHARRPCAHRHHSPSRRRQRRRPLLPRRVRQAAPRSTLLQRHGRPLRPPPLRTRFRSALPTHRTVRNTPRTHHVARLAPHTAHTRRSPSAPLRSPSAPLRSPSHTQRSPSAASQRPPSATTATSAPTRRDTAGASARLRLALASGSRANRTARRAARHARHTLRAVRSQPTAPHINIARRLLLTRAHTRPERPAGRGAVSSPARRRLALASSSRADRTARPPPVALAHVSRADHTAQCAAHRHAQHATHTTLRAARSHTRTNTTTRAPTRRAQHAPTPPPPRTRFQLARRPHRTLRSTQTRAALCAPSAHHTRAHTTTRNTPRTQHNARHPHTHHALAKRPHRSARQAPRPGSRDEFPSWGISSLRQATTCRTAAPLEAAAATRKRGGDACRAAAHLTTEPAAKQSPHRGGGSLSAGFRAGPRCDVSGYAKLGTPCPSLPGRPLLRPLHYPRRGDVGARQDPHLPRDRLLIHPRLVGGPSAIVPLRSGYCGPTPYPTTRDLAKPGASRQLALIAGRIGQRVTQPAERLRLGRGALQRDTACTAVAAPPHTPHPHSHARTHSTLAAHA